MNDSRQPRLSRRRIFAAAGGAGALTATAALLPLIPAMTPVAVDAKVSPDHGRYHLTPHMLRYYQTARI